jgi:hypothetical protein
MSILDKLKQDFIAVKPAVVVAAPQAKKEDVVIAEQSTTLPTLCKNCHEKHFWQPVRSEAWKCFKCSPPPIAAMVAKERGGPVRLAAPAAKHDRLVVLKIYYCRSEQCDICNGRMVSETTFDDNEFSIHCATCGSLLG